MEIIRQDREDVDAVSSLVIGTEACDILLLNPTGASIDVRCTYSKNFKNLKNVFVVDCVFTYTRL